MGTPGTPGNNPFVEPAPREWQTRWIDAVQAIDGASVPRDALENIAPFIVRPKDALTEPDERGERRFKDGLCQVIATDAGEMLVAEVLMHGAGGVVWEHNERISSVWHSAADPAAASGDQRSLPRVRPYVRTTEAGQDKVFAALASQVANREDLVATIEQAVNQLAARDGHRPYDLLEDLVLNGQREPGLYVPQHFTLAQDPPTDDNGEPLHPRSYWGWMAVRGNNRTQRRQELFQITSAEVLTGVPFAKLGMDGEDISTSPRYWLKALSALLNKEYGAAQEAGDTETRAWRAAQVAVVRAHLVIGSPTPQRLFRIVQVSNRHDHVHPPLGFTANDRGRALGRSILGAYVAAGVLDDTEAEALSGTAPITELPGVPERADVSVLRDLRAMRLLAELFPSDEIKRRLIRRALSEGPPSLLNSDEVNQRARAWSALCSESYPKPWNPRVAEVFRVRDVRPGLTPSGRPLPELLDRAADDDDAFEELIAYRAPHWLAFFDLIDADRGSLTGQQTDDDHGTRAARIRRTVTNSLFALRANRTMAVGLLRELALAMDEGDRRPRKIRPDGEPADEPANRAWFNRAFPKESGTRPYRARGNGTGPGPGQLTTEDAGPGTEEDTGPEEDTGAAAAAVGMTDEKAVLHLTRKLEQQTQLLADTAAGLRELLADLRDRAAGAGRDHALDQGQADEQVLLITKTLGVLRMLPEEVQSMAG